MFNRPVGNPGSVHYMFSKTFAALEEMQNHVLPTTVDNSVDKPAEPEKESPVKETPAEPPKETVEKPVDKPAEPPVAEIKQSATVQKPEEKKVIDPEMEALKTQIESIPIEVLKELVQKTNSGKESQKSNRENPLEFSDSSPTEAKTPQELNAETTAETKPETPDFSALAAGDYVAFIQSKGNFPPKFYTSLRDVLIDMTILSRPELISDKLVRIDPAFGVMFEEVQEMQNQPGFLAELISELDAGTLGQPVQQPVNNMRQAAVHTKRQKHQQRGKHSYE